VSDFTKSEQRFAEYLDAEGYTWKHEPDYQGLLGLSATPETCPDFLIDRDGLQAICEVQEFEEGELDRRLSTMRAGVLSDKDVYGRQRSALVDKARQLEPFAESGIPLVIVLSNPQHVFVGLDDHHVIAAMFGNPKVSIPVDTTGRGVPPGPATHLAEDYGAFVSLQRGEDGERFVARHPHVSGVVIVHERTNEQDFIDEVMARHPSEEPGSTVAAAAAAIAGVKEVNELRDAGRVPDGQYQWVNVYELDGANPLPKAFFNGSRDVRFGFHGEGAYGRFD
jgi:hypothetical protein